MYVSLKFYNPTTNNNVAINKLQKAVSANQKQICHPRQYLREIIKIMALCVFFFISFSFVIFLIKHDLFWGFCVYVFCCSFKFYKIKLRTFLNSCDDISIDLLYVIRIEFIEYE